ncbi:MAG: hypothetical protein EZS28_013670 [Streblomastix strix]|uniref:SH3 domain-containing protein n=1 Tax=Streblomastix strix TaxID=222440 RepID=A0A5J4W892_9EUKA|nr:MAG: hypothetical protein EZS28_013670 [Streblomastix strix]
MQTQGELFEVIADYSGKEGKSNTLSVLKGEIVKVLSKDFVWYTIEKGGQVGRVPKGMLRTYGKQSADTQIASNSVPNSKASNSPFQVARDKFSSPVSSPQNQVDLSHTNNSDQQKLSTPTNSNINIISSLNFSMPKQYNNESETQLSTQINKSSPRTQLNPPSSNKFVQFSSSKISQQKSDNPFQIARDKFTNSTNSPQNQSTYKNNQMNKYEQVGVISRESDQTSNLDSSVKFPLQAMTTKVELFEVISDYPGRDDEQYIPVKQGDVVRVIKKELVWYTVEKGGAHRKGTQRKAQEM